MTILQRRLSDAEVNNGQLNEELEKVTDELMTAMQRLNEESQSRYCTSSP